VTKFCESLLGALYLDSDFSQCADAIWIRFGCGNQKCIHSQLVSSLCETFLFKHYYYKINEHFEQLQYYFIEEI